MTISRKVIRFDPDLAWEMELISSLFLSLKKNVIIKCIGITLVNIIV